MESQEPPATESGLRLGTKNLVMSALEEELVKTKKNFKGTPFQVKEIEGSLDYSQIPKIIERDPQGSYLYLVPTKDISGIEFTRISSSDVRKLFQDFDTVVAITQATFDGRKKATGVFKIKIRGNYAGSYATEE